MSNNKELTDFRKQVRETIANYMYSEGCSCCQDIDGHKKHSERLAKLLSVPRYKDGSGFDFARFSVKP